MLETLTIKQIALIDEVSIHFHPGMQVLTGETGAGKSIVVDAVNLILGGRADRELIRSGHEKGSVEAIFNIQDNPSVRAFLDKESIEYDGQTLTIYREITTGGKNICRICGIVFPVSVLRDLSAYLMDLHGQSEHQFLTDNEKQLEFLDQTGDKNHQELLNEIKTAYERFIENHRAYAKMVKKNENREARMKSLEHDLEMLEKAKIKPDEEEMLLQKRKRFAESEEQALALSSIIRSLSGNESDQTYLSGIKDASDLMQRIASKDSSFSELSSRLESVYYEIEELSYEISARADRLDYSPEEIERTDRRLDLIHRIEHKLGVSANEIPEAYENMQKEYRELAELENATAQMSADHKKLLSEYRTIARRLTESRKALSSVFENKIMQELSDLGMQNTKFSIRFMAKESDRPLMPTEHGDDSIEFLISPNPGEPLKPLARIASGGELSRFMLAVKTIESTHHGVDSMVFDEIDTGISGRMAQAVAEKMITIATERQVICVTHLPQIAAAADYHFLVKKSQENNRTHTSVYELTSKGRTEEVSRMISGAEGLTAESDSYASSMLDAAEGLKQRIKGQGI